MKSGKIKRERTKQVVLSRREQRSAQDQINESQSAASSIAAALGPFPHAKHEAPV